MVKARARLGASVLLVSAAVPGLVAPPSIAVVAPAVSVDPGGGCWRYVPDLAAPVSEPADPTAITDLSDGLEPWSAGAPALSLSTSGGSAVGRDRTFLLELPEGPVVEPAPTAAASATVTAVLAYGDTVLDPFAAVVEIPAAVADEAVSVGAVEITGGFPIVADGPSLLTLRALYVDVPDLGLRIACNGQVEGVPGGANPATAPAPTAVVAGFDAVASSAVEVAAVSRQRGTGAARAGDTLTLVGSGLDAGATADVELCPVSGDAACVAAAEIVADGEGAWSAEVTVPAADALADVIGDGASTGGGGRIAVRVTPAADPADPAEPAEPAEVRLRFLGEPTVEVEERDGAPRPVRLAGADWDPGRTVRVRGLDDAGDPVGRPVLAVAGERGVLRLRTTRPTRATGLRALQRRPGGPLVVEAELSEAEVEAPVADPTPTAETPVTPATLPPAVAAPPVSSAVTPPADIPEPEPMAVEEVPAPEAATPAPVPTGGEVAVTDAELVGTTTLPDLFGAAPRRILRLTVENIGTTVVTAPGLEISVGRSEDVEPIYASAGLGSIEPGQTQQIEVPIALGVGALGTYRIEGRLGEGETGAFSLTWQTYPWGLIGLNLAGAVLLVWAVNRRLGHRPSPLLAAALVPATAATVPAGAAGGAARADDAVVDLETLERWWALQAVPGGLAAAAVAGPGAVAATVGAPAEDPGAVVDVEAVERWLARLPERGPEGG
ncbi:hypothetical protein [Nocardioides sp. YIM 152588]|uniref:hypothetical protein n=1 Tax=Nocardioides sp. YIM 152588 TaxID=3158259 RepID=UPI0032E3D60B